MVIMQLFRKLEMYIISIFKEQTKKEKEKKKSPWNPKRKNPDSNKNLFSSCWDYKSLQSTGTDSTKCAENISSMSRYREWDSWGEHKTVFMITLAALGFKSTIYGYSVHLGINCFGQVRSIKESYSSIFTPQWTINVRSVLIEGIYYTTAALVSIYYASALKRSYVKMTSLKKALPKDTIGERLEHTLVVIIYSKNRLLPFIQAPTLTPQTNWETCVGPVVLKG